MTKIEPPLVEGEWVVAEYVSDIKPCKITYHVEGVVSSIGSDVEIDGWHIGGHWTILERRPPKPEWADADAILIEWSPPLQGPEFERRRGEGFGAYPVERWQDSMRRGAIKSIRGLYLRDES